MHRQVDGINFCRSGIVDIIPVVGTCKEKGVLNIREIVQIDDFRRHTVDQIRIVVIISLFGIVTIYFSVRFRFSGRRIFFLKNVMPDIVFSGEHGPAGEILQFVRIESSVRFQFAAVHHP